MGMIEELDALAPKMKSHQTERALTREQGLAVLRAMRRGMTGKVVAETIGVARGNLYAKLGAWAMNHCRCCDEEK